MVAVASGPSNRAGFAGPRCGARSITQSLALGAALQLPRTSGFFAGCITISRHGRDWEKPGWTSSPVGGRDSVSRRIPVARRRRAATWWLQGSLRRRQEVAAEARGRAVAGLVRDLLVSQQCELIRPGRGGRGGGG